MVVIGEDGRASFFHHNHPIFSYRSRQTWMEIVGQ